MSGNHWQTPGRILDRVRHVGEIALDPCTVDSNPCGAQEIITPESDPDGLLADWWTRADGGLIYVNPPYGRGHVTEWAAKIVTEAGRGCEILALVRSDTSTRWARRLIHASTLINYPPRIRFKGATGSPNFANAIHYFGPRPQTFRRAFQDLGPIVTPIPTNQSTKRTTPLCVHSGTHKTESGE